jgi:hypothetical protein
VAKPSGGLLGDWEQVLKGSWASQHEMSHDAKVFASAMLRRQKTIGSADHGP